MIKLLIYKIDGYYYYFKDKSGNDYMFNIEFYDLLEKPKIGDYLYVKQGLLNENNSLLCFGPIDGKYGKSIESLEDDDIVILCIDNDNLYLKRYYG